MPKYQVVSGDFTHTIFCRTAQQAANDAIGTLKNNFKVTLGALTSVLEVGESEEGTFFFPTMKLVEQNGLVYRKKGM